MMSFYALTALINAVAASVLGYIVFFKNRKKVINKTFGLFCFFVAIWSYAYFFWQISETKETALFWSRALMAGAIFIPISYFHFILNLLNKIKEKKKILIIGYLLFFFFFLSNFTTFFIESVGPKLSFQFWPNPGFLFHPFLLLWSSLLLYSWLLLFNALKKLSGFQKEQVKYVFIGTLLGFIGGSTNYFLWYDIPIYPYGNFLVAFYVGFIAYAILKYRFMDIRFVLSKGTVYIFSLISIITFAFLLMFLSNNFLTAVPFNIAAVLILIISVLLFQPIFRFFEKLASKYFYYTFYSYQTVLTDLGKKLISYLDLEKLSLLIVRTLMDTMKLDRAVVLMRNNGDYIVQKNIGFREENGISLVKDNFLTVWLGKHQKPLVYEELFLMIKDVVDEKEKENLSNLQINMKRIEASICLPLLIESKIMGMIVLGSKISGDPYSEQDINLLTGLANQSSVALQNAKLYSEVQGFGQKMEKEVEKRTAELRKAYEELKKLDKAKSEFISMASHQLRTPLSAIKGYISMVAEGSYGKISGKAKEKLSDVFKSNERLIKIVNELLNISKIELGKIELKKQLIQVEEIVESCYEEMKIEAEKRKLKFIWKKPKHSLPKVKADPLRIGEIVSNLLDNSLKYTKEGKIEIKAEKVDSAILISVKDSGEGLSKEEQKNVFESFTRGQAGTTYWIEGTGLGLYLARKYIELHQGRIWVESKGKGKGSTFFVELPIAAE